MIVLNHITKLSFTWTCSPCEFKNEHLPIRRGPLPCMGHKGFIYLPIIFCSQDINIEFIISVLNTCKYLECFVVFVQLPTKYVILNYQRHVRELKREMTFGEWKWNFDLAMIIKNDCEIMRYCYTSNFPGSSCFQLSLPLVTW